MWSLAKNYEAGMLPMGGTGEMSMKDLVSERLKLNRNVVAALSSRTSRHLTREASKKVVGAKQ